MKTSTFYKETYPFLVPNDYKKCKVFFWEKTCLPDLAVSIW